MDVVTALLFPCTLYFVKKKKKKDWMAGNREIYLQLYYKI